MLLFLLRLMLCLRLRCLSLQLRLCHYPHHAAQLLLQRLCRFLAAHNKRDPGAHCLLLHLRLPLPLIRLLLMCICGPKGGLPAAHS